ncbi:MAG: sigma-54-dependent Fis family transcriptional regulator [Acidobacteria bacterium]|nr:sigma-54-dependent Fis family transcriptional regulator [Acidobacteriota bacterium]
MAGRSRSRARAVRAPRCASSCRARRKRSYRSPRRCVKTGPRASVSGEPPQAPVRPDPGAAPPNTDPAQTQRATVLIVDDEEVIRDVLVSLLLRRGGFEVLAASTGDEANALLCDRNVDVVLLDLFLPGANGLDLLRQVRADDPARQVIMMTAHGSVETAVEAMKSGAFHYLTKPFRNDEVIMLVETALMQRRLRLENAGLRRALIERHTFGRLTGRSREMQRVYRLIEQVAPARTTVLITGESGTGKELTAEAIHKTGSSSDAPFITVNSSNIPSDLLESQLFGHVRGAFTGAVADRTGLFEAAAGGTIFFDEISTIPLSVQAKLLRVLQEKEFLPLGSVRPVKVDVRILAATNEDLERLVREGNFREDLFYRLNVITIALPSLRDRREDIPLLAEQFLIQFADEHLRPGMRLAPDTVAALVRYRWPGNVRQLRNVVERAVLLAPGEDITPDLIPSEVFRAVEGDEVGSGLPVGLTFHEAVGEYERSLIAWALRESGGVQRRAAELLSMKPTTLSERMKRLGIR